MISALIASYRASRAAAKEIIEPERFLGAYIKAPLEVCEARNPKGLYAKVFLPRGTHTQTLFYRRSELQHP